MRSKLRGMHSWLSYCAVTNAFDVYSIGNSPHFAKTQKMWRSIMNTDAVKHEKAEKAVLFTESDQYEINNWNIRLTDGTVHIDWLRRKLFAKLQDWATRRGFCASKLRREDLVLDLEIMPGRYCYRLSTPFSKTCNHTETHIIPCECGPRGLKFFADNYGHDPENLNCTPELIETWIEATDEYEKTYCEPNNHAPIKPGKDYLFRCINYQKGQKVRKCEDEYKKRYIARKPWGSENENGWRANNKWLNNHLHLSVAAGTNLAAKTNKMRKNFTSY